MIEKQSGTAMYEQISDILKEEIRTGKYGEAGCIGTHTALADRFQVSLITIRKAVQQLADEQYVTIRQGKGTFVKSPFVRDDSGKLTGVSNILQHNHRSAQVSVRIMELIDTPELPDISVRKALGPRCLYVERAHVAAEQVIGYARLYLPIRYRALFSREALERKTVYQCYEQDAGLRLGKGLQSIRANRAGEELAGLMGLTADTPVLQIERKAYSFDHELLEYMILYYEHSQYTFQIELDLSAN